MPQRSILVADDIENQADSDKERSQVICSVASSLAQQLKTGIDFLYVEDIKSYTHDKFDASRIQRMSWPLARCTRRVTRVIHLW
jgi:hypothetical protein